MADSNTKKYTAPFNFGSATERDQLLYGSARPGAVGQICYDPSNKMPQAEVLKWVEFMKEQGIQRVVSLLTNSELDTFEPGYEESMKENFKFGHVDVKGGGTFQAVQQLVQEAYDANEKVLVHCWGGGGRAGATLAALIAQRYNLTPEEAAEEITQWAASHDCKRKADLEQVKGLLA